ncbi:unnamed protein product [Parnassius apollo]|uniref:(apollo) hypothetical protein n=1 Tax=Parnassius apollo TaxID=110799 RepID=A0A8S3WW20_PARAO|nr:unnamed protein product [Parnassius apollo]
MLVKSLITGMIRSRIMALRTPRLICRNYRREGPPQPFDNMPFSVPNRYAATMVFSIFFGIGLWAPFIIVWYSMAKRTM